MTLFQKILHKLNGMHYVQEYLCLPAEQHTHHLHVFLVNKNIVIKDITTHHLMVGICPLIFALPSLEELDLDTQESIKIYYSVSLLKIGSTISKKNIIAALFLKKITTQKTGPLNVYYFEGVKGRHGFLSSFHQFINRLNNSLYNKKRSNIFLQGNLYTQIQIVYSIPQIISLITVGSNGLYNIFPTDQHGQIYNNYYIITLRHAGNACKQVELAKKIVLSNMHASYYKEVYSLGKNHMQPLKEKSNFNFSEAQTQILQLPLPLHTIEYRELELKDSFTHGIHKILLFKILSHQKINGIAATLSCINNTYATWRWKQKQPCDYFLP